MWMLGTPKLYIRYTRAYWKDGTHEANCRFFQDQSHFWVDFYHVPKNTWDLFRLWHGKSRLKGGWNIQWFSGVDNPFNKRLQGLKSFTKYHHLFPERPEYPRICLEWFFQCTQWLSKKKHRGGHPSQPKESPFPLRHWEHLSQPMFQGIPNRYSFHP